MVLAATSAGDPSFEMAACSGLCRKMLLSVPLVDEPTSEPDMLRPRLPSESCRPRWSPSPDSHVLSR